MEETDAIGKLDVARCGNNTLGKKRAPRQLAHVNFSHQKHTDSTLT